MRADFEFYGIRVRIISKSVALSEVLENLEQDFAYFRCSEPLNGDAAEIELILEGRDLPAEKQPKRPLFKNRLCRIYGLGPRRFCDYGSGVWVEGRHRGSEHRFKVYGTRAPLIYECAYLALLSSIGEELDYRGYHRLHALAIQRGEKATAVYAASGFGKSTAALKLCQDPSVKIYSDEMPLIRGKQIYPFPIRMAVAPGLLKKLEPELKVDTETFRTFKRKIYPEKVLVPLPFEKVAEAARLDTLILGNFRPGRFRSRAWFILSFVMGLGIAQMAEHLLRSNNLLRLAKIALSRLATAVELLTGCQIRRISETDPMKLADRLHD